MDTNYIVVHLPTQEEWDTVLREKNKKNPQRVNESTLVRVKEWDFYK